MAHILLIDDDSAIRHIGATVLRAAGHTVTEAEDGKEGITQFRSLHPDLVITDLVMPGQGGIETIIELQRMKPVPRIIGMSGVAHSPAFLKMAKALGARRTLAKPFTKESLMVVVNDVLASV
jgi:two-component system, chemotaxis family, chemotaxis protein CheY